MFALLRLGFPSAPHVACLTSPAVITRRTVLQKVRGRTSVVLPQLVDTGFQVLFHSPPGVLFTFPSQYCCAIGHWVVFSLTGWSPLIPTRFPVSRGTLDPAGLSAASDTGLSPSLAGFPKAVLLPLPDPLCSPNPGTHAYRFGLFRVRSPLLAESMFLSLPPGT